MPAKLTQEAFIARCHEVHGDRYDYSQAMYIDMSTKLTIVCRDHGDFQQKPVSHLHQKSGCPVCYRLRIGRASTYAQEEVIARLSARHADLDFSKFTYASAITPGVVVCKKHGEFLSTYSGMMQGHGCRECGALKGSNASKRDPSEVLSELRTKFPDLDFPKFFSEYDRTTDKVTLVCRTHGQFKKAVHKMLSAGQGCPECGREFGHKSHAWSEDEMISKFRGVHGDRYGYSSLGYKGVSEKVSILCPTHGIFEMLASSHLYSGQGCKECGIASRSEMAVVPFNEFVDRARSKHGDKYSYCEASYTKVSGKVLITCPEHGEFRQNCFDHIYGAGCRLCIVHDGGFKPHNRGSFYVYDLRTSLGDFVGFGISGNMPLRMLQHEQSFISSGAYGKVLKVFDFRLGTYAEQLEDLVMENIPRESSGVPGFIREAARVEHTEKVLSFAAAYHEKYSEHSVAIFN